MVRRYGLGLTAHLPAGGFVFLVFLFSLFPLFRCQAAAPDQTQVLTLNANWNLISIQVGDDTGFTVAEIAAGLSGGTLKAIWSYEAETQRWTTHQPLVAGFPHNDLTHVKPGHGYWVEVSEQSTLSLTGPVWNGGLSFSQGWNLVGFPGLTAATFEEFELESVFSESFNRVSEVWEFDALSDTFTGYDFTAIPQLFDLDTVRAGKAYWVNALEDFELNPRPFVALSPDSDIAPLGDKVPFTPGLFPAADPAIYTELEVRPAGTEDAPQSASDVGADLNDNGIVDDAFTQNTIFFSGGVDRQTLSFGNTGGNLSNWSLEEDIPWLEFSITNGTVTTERDVVMATINRDGLLPGIHRGETFIARFGGEEKEVAVILEVADFAGDWKGFAQTTRVNGKDIPLGKVDLYLHMFQDAANSNAFKAVVNRDQSLLFPNDVFMNGIFFAANQFSMTTGFLMQKADRNVPPYDTFSNDTREFEIKSGRRRTVDKDADGDKVLDNLNPFPVDVRREMTLIGSRVEADKMEGSYIESIRGLLPGNQLIFIEGIFELRRRTFEPTLRSIYNEKDSANAIIGGSSGGSQNRIVREITVDDAVTIDNVEVNLDVVFANPDELSIFLEGPGGIRVTLHDQTEAIISEQSLSDFRDLQGNFTWRLIVEWTGASTERGRLVSWDLNLEGLATYEVSGRIVEPGGDPIINALVTVTGSNLIDTRLSSTNGTFAVAGLTENEYQVSISKLGFETTATNATVINADIDLGDIELTPVGGSEAFLLTSPPVGTAPLHVGFFPVIPLGLVDAQLGNITNSTWQLQQGFTTNDTESVFIPIDTLSATGAEFTYIFTNPGVYRATVEVQGDLPGSLVLTSEVIIAHSMQPDPAADTNVFGIGFIGSIASANNPANIIETNQVTIGSNDYIVVYQESKRDAANFDVDRFPTNSFNHLEEDSDFFVQPLSHFAINGSPGEVSAFPGTAQGTFEIPGTDEGQPYDRIIPYRISCTLGGYVFGGDPDFPTAPRQGKPAVVGNFVLQSGRIEP